MGKAKIIEDSSLVKIIVAIRFVNALETWAETYEREVFDPAEWDSLSGLNKPNFFYSSGVDDPALWAKAMINWFNRTRHSSEMERAIVSVNVVPLDGAAGGGR